MYVCSIIWQFVLTLIAPTKSPLFWEDDSIVCLQWSSYAGTKQVEFKGFPETAAPYYIHSTFSIKWENFGIFLLNSVYKYGSTE